jgi:hypothetical protein
MKTVSTEIWSVGRVAASDLAGMEALYRRYYEGAAPEAFRRDFAAKDLVILLRDADVVCGFSTLKLLSVAGMNVLFSGDTVVDEACRNQTGLAGAFGHVMKKLAGDGVADPYWFLICKGARTYRFLPTFFRRYVPGKVADPELAGRLRAVASALYPTEYDPETGLLHFGADKDRLWDDALRRDRESVRFRTLNPDWWKGDELCCFAPLDLANLNRLGERVIADVTPEWHLA